MCCLDYIMFIIIIQTNIITSVATPMPKTTVKHSENKARGVSKTRVRRHAQ